LKYLIPCLHFSENFKNLENLGGVKLKHLLEIQNTQEISFTCRLLRLQDYRYNRY